MAGKQKDFSNINTENQYTQQIETATGTPIVKLAKKDRKEVRTEEEARAAQMAGKTRGRKGAGYPRINMAFFPDVHEYIQIMARVSGMSTTDFVNEVLRKSMETNAELYARARSFREDLK